jgi:protein CWC15
VDDSDADDAEEDSDDEDDTAALMAELQRIKKERAAEQAKREAEKRAEEEKIRAENILSGNPLLAYTGTAKSDMKVKRRWDEDVVFKNCARADDGSKNKGFINDCLRSDFHKKFMEKYIK